MNTILKWFKDGFHRLEAKGLRNASLKLCPSISKAPLDSINPNTAADHVPAISQNRHRKHNRQPYHRIWRGSNSGLTAAEAIHCDQLVIHLE